MSLLRLGTYDVPDEYITKYDYSSKKVYGATEEMENGYTYTEQTRSKKPVLSVELTNVTQDIVDSIVDNVDKGQFAVTFYAGKARTEQMRLSDDPSISLTSCSDVKRFTIKFKLEG